MWEQCLVTTDAGQIATISCVPYLIQRLVEMAVNLSGGIAVFFVIWGGIKLVRSGGDPKQVEGARHTITYAIIGLIIVIMSYVIISIISRVTGLGCIRFFGFTQCTDQGRISNPVVGVDGDEANPTSWGCFYNTDEGAGTVINPADCYPYDPGGNSPASPYYGWYNNETNCRSACERYR